MALENVLVYDIVTGDTTYPHSGTFTVVEGGQLTIDDSNGTSDAIFGDFTDTGGADQPDQNVTASTVAGIVPGDLADSRYRYSYTGSDGSSGTIYLIATNGLANYGSWIVSPTQLSPAVTYTFGTFNRNGAVPYSSLVPCFTLGTLIQTKWGDKPIEDLRVGDLIITRDNGLQPLRWIGRCTVPALGSAAPIHIAKRAMGNAAPLLVSPNHRMLIDSGSADYLFGVREVLIVAKHLLPNPGVSVKSGGEVTYIHLLFEEHQIVSTHGCPSESFFPGREAMSALNEETRQEVLDLFPELIGVGSNRFEATARMCLKPQEAQLLYP